MKPPTRRSPPPPLTCREGAELAWPLLGHCVRPAPLSPPWAWGPRSSSARGRAGMGLGGRQLPGLGAQHTLAARCRGILAGGTGSSGPGERRPLPHRPPPAPGALANTPSFPWDPQTEPVTSEAGVGLWAQNTARPTPNAAQLQPPRGPEEPLRKPGTPTRALLKGPCSPGPGALAPGDSSPPRAGATRDLRLPERRLSPDKPHGFSEATPFA